MPLPMPPPILLQCFRLAPPPAPTGATLAGICRFARRATGGVVFASSEALERDFTPASRSALTRARHQRRRLQSPPTVASRHPSRQRSRNGRSMRSCATRREPSPVPRCPAATAARGLLPAHQMTSSILQARLLPRRSEARPRTRPPPGARIASTNVRRFAVRFFEQRLDDQIVARVRARGGSMRIRCSLMRAYSG